MSASGTANDSGARSGAFEVVTAGETMVLGVPSSPTRLRHAGTLELKVGGAESNLAIALSRLGVRVSWASALGPGEPGQLVLDRIRGEGVDVSRVRRFEDSFTGLYLRDSLGSQTRNYYYRKDSAASRLSEGVFAPELLAGASFLHLTGITPALSESCRDFTHWAIQQAREAGARVSFDLNFRSKLWSAEQAGEFLAEILPQTDLVFASAEEARALWGRAEPEFLLDLAGSSDETEVIVKHGSEGCELLVGGEKYSRKAFPVLEVDPIGAGDAFAAGYLAASLRGGDYPERLRLASALGALSVSSLGDYEGLPMRDELETFLDGEKDLGR